MSNLFDATIQIQTAAVFLMMRMLIIVIVNDDDMMIHNMYDYL